MENEGASSLGERGGARGGVLLFNLSERWPLKMSKMGKRETKQKGRGSMYPRPHWVYTTLSFLFRRTISALPGKRKIEKQRKRERGKEGKRERGKERKRGKEKERKRERGKKVERERKKERKRERGKKRKRRDLHL